MQTTPHGSPGTLVFCCQSVVYFFPRSPEIPGWELLMQPLCTDVVFSSACERHSHTRIDDDPLWQLAVLSIALFIINTGADQSRTC